MTSTLVPGAAPASTASHIAAAGHVLAHTYHPLPVVVARAEGAWVTDVDGRRYLDCLAAYSAVNFGHGHPALLAAAHAQLDRVTLTSRAFHNDRLAGFAAALADLTHTDRVVPMNTGAEAVETGIKIARKWGHDVRGIAEPTIVVANGNFHGRTTTIVGFSDDPTARAGFGPFTPGFRAVPFGDAEAISAAIDATTAAVLLEPIQGEAGVIVPPAGYLARVREICDSRGVLLIADEVQTGFARTGRTFACEHSGVQPDLYLLGKALGGGIVPVSAVVGRADVVDVLTPGSHGSTFGGNPLAAAVGSAVLDLVATGEFQERSATLGVRLLGGLRGLVGHGLTEVRGIGLWAGIDVEPSLGTARDLAEVLMELGLLAKDTHQRTLRLAPPLVVTPDEVDLIVESVAKGLRRMAGRATPPPTGPLGGTGRD